MKTNLQSARVRPMGAGGLAQRTAAGFVLLGSADASDVLPMITANQSNPTLIELVAAKVAEVAPEAFAMLFTSGGELFLLGWGLAQATIESKSSRLIIAPQPGQVLIDRLNFGLNDAAGRISLTRDPKLADVDGLNDELVDLQSGTVPADAVTVTVVLESTDPAEPADAGASSPPPAAQEILFAEDLDEITDLTDAPEPAVAVDDSSPTAQEPPTFGAADGDASAVQPAPSEAIVVPTEAASSASIALDDASSVAAPVMVLGIACPQGHHNHPDAVYCSQCGTKMGVHHTTVLLNGPRPPLGVLIVDDGTTYSITADLVIGREPSAHSDVVSGAAQSMALTDETLSLSRRHARILLDDWSVFVTDLHSSNGTWLNRDGGVDEWSPVPSDVSIPLQPGDRLRVGGRIIQVELHHVR